MNNLRSRFVILALMFCGLSVVSSAYARPVIGVVDEKKLAAIDENYPMLAQRVLVGIAKEKQLKIIITASGMMWVATATEYVDITPDVLSRLRSLSPPKTGHVLRSTSPPKTGNSLTQAQQSDFNEALKSLRKLNSATEVGLTYQAYGERLIDAKADVDQYKRSLPANLQKQLDDVLEPYIDARRAWQNSIQYPDISVFSDDETNAILQKYGLTQEYRDLTAKNPGPMPGKFIKQTLPSSLWAIAQERLAKIK